MIDFTSNLDFIRKGDCQALMEVINQNSERARNALFTQDLKLLMDSAFENTEYIFWMCTSLVLSGTDEVTDKLKEFQFSKRTLRWFLEQNDLNNQLDIIQDQGIEVDRQFVLLNIHYHLVFKFYADFHFDANAVKLVDKVPINRSTQYFKNLKERRNKNGGLSPKFFKGDKEYLINDKINQTITETENNFDLDVVINASKGKTEKLFLKNMLETGFKYDKAVTSERKFLATVYDLFRMIMLDKSMDNFNAIKCFSGKAIMRNKKPVGYNRKNDYFVTEKANKMKQFFYK